MILYNMTINIDLDIQEDWMAWMQDLYIPGLLTSTMVKDKKFYRLLTEVEGNGPTYSLQLFFDNMEDFEQYDQHVFNPQLELMYAQYQGRFVEFRSILESI